MIDAAGRDRRCIAGGAQSNWGDMRYRTTLDRACNIFACTLVADRADEALVSPLGFAMLTLTMRSDAIIDASTPDDPWAVVSPSNPLDGGGLLADLKILGAGGGRVVAWSGWISDHDAGDEAAQRETQGIFARSPQTWGPSGWSAFEGVMARALPLANEVGATLVLRPHARHVLSDAQRCLSFLRKYDGQPVSILLDPVALLEPGMIAHAEDHVIRTLESLGHHPRVAGVVISGSRVATGEDDEPAVLPAPATEGVGPLVASLVARLVGAATPRVEIASAG